MLNEFLPDVWKRRITADESRISKREVILTRQLRKARIYLAACDKLRGGSEHYGLFEKGERDILSCPY